MDFCCTIFLLESARMMMGGYDGGAMIIFAALIFVGTVSIFCWNHVVFLLESYQCFAGNKIIFCWNHIKILLEPCCIFAETI